MKNRFSSAAALLSLVGCSGAFSPVHHRPVQQYQETTAGSKPTKSSSVSLDMSAEMDSFIPVLLGLGALVGTVKPDFVSGSGASSSGGSGATSGGGGNSGATTGGGSSGSGSPVAPVVGGSSAAGSGAGTVADGTQSPGGGGSSSGESDGECGIGLSAYRLARALLFPWIGIFRK